MASGSTTRRRPAATEPAGWRVDRKIVIAVLVALAVGWAAPKVLERRPDRPVLRWVAAAAKNLLWVAMLAERPPEQDANRLVQSKHPGDSVDHGRGW